MSVDTDSSFNSCWAICRRHTFSEAYGRCPLHIPGSPDKFTHLFALSDLNAILNFSSLLYPESESQIIATRSTNMI